MRSVNAPRVAARCHGRDRSGRPRARDQPVDRRHLRRRRSAARSRRAGPAQGQPARRRRAARRRRRGGLGAPTAAWRCASSSSTTSARRRIQRLVQKREPTYFGKRDVRIHLPVAAGAAARQRARSDRARRHDRSRAALAAARQPGDHRAVVRPRLRRARAVDRPRRHALRLGAAAHLRRPDRGDAPTVDAAGPPPRFPSPTTPCRSVPTRSGGPPSPRRWLWPSLALGGFLASGAAVAVALLRPTAAAAAAADGAARARQRRRAHLPTRVTVPTEKPRRERRRRDAGRHAGDGRRSRPPAPAKPAPRQERAAQDGAARKTARRGARLRRELADVLELLRQPLAIELRAPRRACRRRRACARSAPRATPRTRRRPSWPARSARAPRATGRRRSGRCENSRSRRSAGGSPVWFHVHQQRHQVLVDLGLQLELDRRDRPLLPRAVHQIDEVAHALDGEQEVLQVALVEPAPRIAHRQVLQRPLVDEQPELQPLVVACG